MEHWKRRRYIRSSTLLILLLLFLIWYWWTHAPVARPPGTRPADPIPIEAGAWIVEPLVDSGYLPVLLDEIASAERTIDAALFVIRADSDAPRTRSILEALVKAARRGVRIRLVLDKPENPEESHYRFNREAADFLKPAGIEVRFDQANVEMHDKMILFDHDRFIVGAHNWTEAALTHNRELSLLIRPVERATAPRLAFESLWRGGPLGETPPADADDEGGEDAI
jgi:phosphatidylserine/phosphatidylglycerophosphate/cardiolipin synthase-like enzyme